MGALFGIVRALGASAVGAEQGQIDAMQMRRMLQMYALQQAKMQADIGDVTSRTQHQRMVNSVGPAGIEGSPQNVQYKGQVAAAEAFGKLPAELQQMVLSKQIDLANAIKLAGVNTSLDVNYKIPAETQAGIAKGAIETGMQQSGSPMTRIAQHMGNTGMSPADVASQYPVPPMGGSSSAPSGAAGGSVDAPAPSASGAAAPRTHRLISQYGLTMPGQP